MELDDCRIPTVQYLVSPKNNEVAAPELLKAPIVSRDWLQIAGGGHTQYSHTQSFKVVVVVLEVGPRVYVGGPNSKVIIPTLPLRNMPSAPWKTSNS